MTPHVIITVHSASVTVDITRPARRPNRILTLEPVYGTVDALRLMAYRPFDNGRLARVLADVPMSCPVHMRIG